MYSILNIIIYIYTYYIILYHIMLYYAILYYIISYHIISYHIILYYIILYYIILYYVYILYIFCIYTYIILYDMVTPSSLRIANAMLTSLHRSMTPELAEISTMSVDHGTCGTCESQPWSLVQRS